jgi:hypothetical protein
MVGTLAFGALVASATMVQAQDRLNFTGSADLHDVPGSGGSQLFIDFLIGGTTSGAGGTPRPVTPPTPAPRRGAARYFSLPIPATGAPWGAPPGDVGVPYAFVLRRRRKLTSPSPPSPLARSR